MEGVSGGGRPFLGSAADPLTDPLTDVIEPATGGDNSDFFGISGDDADASAGGGEFAVDIAHFGSQSSPGATGLETFDSQGNLATLTDANGEVTQFTQSRKGVRTFCSGFPVLVALGRGRRATVKQKVLKSPRKEAVRICLTARNH